MARNFQKLLVLLIYLLVLAPNLAVSVPCDTGSFDEPCTQFSYLDGKIVGKPSNPMSGRVFIYPKADSLYLVNSNGDEIKIGPTDIPAATPTIVIDNLTSTSPTAALSANQGRILNNKTIQNATAIASNTTAIADLADNPTITVVDTLTSASVEYALSANQGRVLNVTKGDVWGPTAGTALQLVKFSPVMTSNILPTGYVANGSPVPASPNPYFYAFDGNTFNDYYSTSITPLWVSLQLPAPKALKSYKVYVGGDGSTKWTLSGSVDGTTWSILHNVVGAPSSAWYTYTFPASHPLYSYFKIEAPSDGTDGGWGVGDFYEAEFYEEVLMPIPIANKVAMFADETGKLLKTADPASQIAVIDNLTSQSTTSALSANQGRVLNNELGTKIDAPPYTGGYLYLSYMDGVGPQPFPTCDGGSYPGTIGHTYYVICTLDTPTLIDNIQIDANNGHAPLSYDIQVSSNGSTWITIGSTGGLPTSFVHNYPMSSNRGPWSYFRLWNVRGRNSPVSPENPQVNEIWVTGYQESLVGKIAVYSTSSGSALTYTNWTVPFSPGTNGQVLTSNGTNATWVTGAGGGTIVVDALNSTSTTSALSANQGRVLDNKITAIHTHTNKPALDVVKNNGTTTEFLSGAGTYLTPAGGGNVVGPGTSTANAIAIYSGTTGKIIQNSPATIDPFSGQMVLTGMTSEIWIVGSGTFKGIARPGSYIFGNPVNNNGITFSGPDAPPVNYTIKLPDAAPANAQILQSNGIGQLSWINTPAGGAATVVIDALNSTSTTAALSANQGRLLDARVTTNTTNITSNTTAITTLQGQTHTHANKALLDTLKTTGPGTQYLSALGTYTTPVDANDITTIVDALNSTSTTSALSANQGRVLNEKVPLTTWATGQSYKIGEIKNSGDNNNWLFKVTQDHTSTNVPADFRTGKILAISPPIITTGLQAGGQATLNAPTRVATVQAGTGYIALYGPAPTAFPQITIVEWPLQTITLPNSPPNIFTLFINSTGVLEYVSGTGATTQAEQDTKISVGIVDMNLGVAYDRETYPTNPVGQLRGLSFFFGGMTRGLSYSAVPATPLTMARTAHDVYYWGANTSDQYNPNTKSMLAISPVPFFEYYKSGPVVPTTRKTVFNTSVWDDGTNDLAVLSNNKWGFVRIYSAPGVDDYIMYAQAEYADEAAAKAAAISTNFIKPVDLTLTKFSAWFVFQKDDLDLTNNLVTVCEPFGCDKIGTSAGGVAGGGGAGDVLGPSSSVVGNLALYADTSGKVIKSDNMFRASGGSLSIGDSVSESYLNMTGPTDNFGTSISNRDSSSSIALTSKDRGDRFSASVYGNSVELNLVGIQESPVISFLRDTDGFFNFHIVKLAGPDTATAGISYTIKLPNLAPTNNQILQAQSNGQLSWINTPAGGAATIVVDALNSTSTTSALSANQGRILDSKITPLTAASHSHTNKTLLDSLISNGAATLFLAADGTYKTPVDTNSVTVVEDLLTSISAVNALSANQGRVLKGLVDTNTSNIATHTTSITALQGTSHSHTNKATLDVVKNNGTTAEFLSGAGTYVTPSIPAAVTVVDNLTSTSTTSALSANQGKVLNDKITPLQTASHSHTNKTLLDTLTSAGSATTYLSGAGTYTTPPDTTQGPSDVQGPANSTDTYIAVYSGTTGKIIKQAKASITAAGDFYTDGDFYFGGGGSNAGGIHMYENSGTNSVSLSAPPTISQAYTLVYPSTKPAANQILQSDVNGLLSWINTPAAGAGDVVGPAGADDGSVAMFSGTAGKALKQYSGFSFASGYLTLGPLATSMTGIKFTSGGVGTVTLASSGSNNSNYTINLPTTAPGTNQILLAQNTGQLSWVALPVDTNTVTTVVDNLTSSSATSALSANQGRLLDARVTTNATNIATNVTDINALEATTHSHTNKTLLDSLVSNGAGTAYLANDGTYKVIAAATGDVVGPAGATDLAIAIYDTATGKKIKNSGVTIDASNNIYTPGKLTVVGPILSTQPAVKANLIFDFNEGNNQVSSSNCGSVQLNNTVDGGVYSIVLTGATSAQCSFSGTPTFTVHLPVGHGSTVGSKHTLFTFTRLNGHMYIGWNPGL